MDSSIIKRIAQEASLPETSVAATLELFEAGGTAPFISRYRKEATGGMDDANVRVIQERMTYYKELEERRAQLVKSLTEQGKMTEDLRRQIEGCWDRFDIEDLHHRFRPNRKSRASAAIEKGLEPLADYIWSQDPDAWSLEEHVDVFIDPVKGVADRQQALQGACEIITDWIAESFELRKVLRESLWKEGSVVSTVVPAKADQKTKYSMYYDRKEPVSSIPSHRILAIRRGTKEGVLTSSIQGDSAQAVQQVIDFITRDKESEFAPILEIAARDSYSRTLRPLIETEVRAQLKERADREAIRVFHENLENLLLSPPAGTVPVLGVDAGKGEACHLAAVDENGRFLEEAVIFPRPPKSDIEGTKTTLVDLIQKHHLSAVAVGSGPGARETESILRGILSDANLKDVTVAAVNDAGVVVYSSSRIGREELPELSVAARSAVSTARRLQDPLSELVKIDPKLIGVGQYQHDVDQKELHRRLVQTVQLCVNRVGADVNAASFSLLRYVSGISDRLARRIVMHRSANGPFPTREALKSIPGMDERTYQQSAGFLRIPNSEVLLDRTSIHPECYPVVEKMAASLNLGIADLIGNREVIDRLKLEEFASESVGAPSLALIREELLAPGKDPRGSYAPPKFHSEIRDLADLKEGLTLEGIVTNVTNFGAFVDIGIHQDGLVHLSQMSNRFIRDPREAVKVGDLVQVKVISVEVETKRIGLSMKALLPTVPRRRKKPRRRNHDPAPPAPVTAEARPGAAVEAAAGAMPAGDPPEGTAQPQPARHRHPDSGDPHQRRRDYPGRDDFSRRNDPSRRNSQSRRDDSGRRDEYGRRSEVPLRKPAPAPPLPPEIEPEPKGPEPTLQEKIAILQSKFRGIQ